MRWKLRSCSDAKTFCPGCLPLGAVQSAGFVFSGHCRMGDALGVARFTKHPKLCRLTAAVFFGERLSGLVAEPWQVARPQLSLATGVPGGWLKLTVPKRIG